MALWSGGRLTGHKLGIYRETGIDHIPFLKLGGRFRGIHFILGFITYILPISLSVYYYFIY